MGIRRGMSGKYRRSMGAAAKSPKIRDQGGGKRRLFLVRCDQAASLSVASAKNVRALEYTHGFSASLIPPAWGRQSAFISIRAADAASLIGKINSMSHARCMAE